MRTMTATEATLPELLERLLTDPALRHAFAEGRVQMPEALSSIDVVQLERTAAQLVRDLAQRQFRGSGGLSTLYPETVAAFADGVEVLMQRFVASTAYGAYREWPRTGQGQSLEEAFYRFAEADGLGDAAAREREFMGAMVRAVLLSPEPGFTVPSELTIRPRVTFAITTRAAAPHLFAATARGLVQGPITPFLAELIMVGIEGGAPDAVAARHRVPSAVRDAACERLRGLGF